MKVIHNKNLYQNSSWNLNKFRLNNLFIDCFLKSNDQMYPCHQIVLASKSQYFNKYLRSKSELEIELPFNPKNFFVDILNYFYTGNINLNSNNIAIASKYSEFYKIDCLEKLVQLQFKDILSLANCLSISKSLRDNDVHTKDDQIIEIIKNDFLKNSIDNINQIYSSISPNVLSGILSKFGNEITDCQKVEIIENYLLAQKSIHLKEKDKKILSSVIDWSNPDSYKYVIQYKCDWLPSRIIQTKINEILDLRRTLIQNADHDFKLSSKEVSKFYPLVRICEIGNPDLEVKNNYDITNFISTIGGISREINIYQYGFIQLQASTYFPDYIPQFIFDQGNDDNYFLSVGNSQNHPYLAFSFGKDSKFLLTQIEIKTSKPRHQQNQIYLPETLFIECFDDDKFENPLEIVEFEISNGISKIKLALNDSHRYYRIVMNKSDPVRSWVLRLTQIKIYGNFYQ